MGTPGSCTDSDNDNNRTIAKNKGYKDDYEHVPVWVKAHGVNQAGETTITFEGKDLKGNRHPHTAVWGDEKAMWAPCPSSLPSSAVPDHPGQPPAVDSTGELYLYRDLLL